MKTDATLSLDAQQALDGWRARYENLLTDVEGWGAALGWQSRRISMRVRTGAKTAEEVAAMLLEKQGLQLLLSPVLHTGSFGESIVDVCRLPECDDVARMRLSNGGWELWAARKITAHELIKAEPLSQFAIANLLGALEADAA